MLLPLLILLLVVHDAPSPLAAAAALLATLAVHEGGHAIAAIVLGGRPTVGLNPLGAHTLTPEIGYLSRPRRAVLVAAGPLVGLAAAGGVWLALHSGVLPLSAWPFAFWFAYAGLYINAFNLVPVPGLDGARLVELAINDSGYPRRRHAVTVLYAVTVAVAALYAISIEQWLLLGVVALLGTAGIRCRLASPEQRAVDVTVAGLVDDGEQLVRLATREADVGDALGQQLAATARASAAVIHARAGRLDEARSLLVTQGDEWSLERLAVDLLADPRAGAARLVRFVGDRTAGTVPPALLDRASTEQLLDLAVERAAKLDMNDHALVVSVLNAANWNHHASRAALALWHRGLGPDAALQLAIVRGALGDDHGAATWLLAARRAGGDVRTFATYATELDGARRDPRVARLLVGAPRASSAPVAPPA